MKSKIEKYLNEVKKNTKAKKASSNQYNMYLNHIKMRLELLEKMKKEDNIPEVLNVIGELETYIEKLKNSLETT